jgi:hypothetical protein
VRKQRQKQRGPKVYSLHPRGRVPIAILAAVGFNFKLLLARMAALLCVLFGLRIAR